jgi:predicted CoA-binding protein
MGYDIVGTYPGKSEIAGFKIYPTLADVPLEYRKFVDVFRSSERVSEVIDEAISVGGVEVIWLQLGISNPEAESKAEKYGIHVVSDRCLHIEYNKNFTV